MFQTLICSEELNKDEIAKEKLQTWEKSGLQLVLLPCEESLWGNIDLKRALWIVSSKEEWEYGQSMGIACLPFVCDGDYDRFPGASYLLAGFYDVDLDYLEKMYRRAKHLPWEIARKESFILRELTMGDLDGLYSLYEDQSLYPFVEPLYERSREEEYESQYIVNMYGLLGYGMWLVIDPKTEEIIGRAGLENHDYGAETGLELGYLLRKDYRGRGLAKEVCQCILDYAKKELSYSEVNCLIHEENTASIGLAKALGFTFFEDRIENGKKMKRYKLEL